jgi:filamentous hemagglutinin
VNAGRTADFVLDGVKIELKTMTNVTNQTSDGLSKALSSTIMNARGQSGNIVVDARGQAGMTREIAERGVIRGLNADKDLKVQEVTVLTSQGTVYIKRKPS